jgi:hypothetical protein
VVLVKPKRWQQQTFFDGQQIEDCANIRVGNAVWSQYRCIDGSDCLGTMVEDCVNGAFAKNISVQRYGREQAVHEAWITDRGAKPVRLHEGRSMADVDCNNSRRHLGGDCFVVSDAMQQVVVKPWSARC